MLPYAAVRPYSKVTAVDELLALTVPFRVAPLPVTAVAALVTTVGATASVVNENSAP